MDILTPDKTAKIRQLNDLLRSTLIGGVVVTTQGVAGLDPATKSELMGAVMSFKKFHEDNDPHAEHDFGAVEVSNQKFFWKIDYYDRSMEMASEDPSDSKVTKRVLTIMRASEY